MTKNYVLAADLGGTNLRMAGVSPEGSVLDLRRTLTPQTGNASDIIRSIVGEAESCISTIGCPPRAFGVAAAALIDLAGKEVLSSPNLPQLNDFEFADSISEHLGIVVVLENDATAAAIGEHWLGASRDVDDSVCVTLGTGVGGGLILGGRPFRGAGGTGGEIGHICVEPDGIDCGCGSHGCLEQYVSATAVVRIVKELLSNNAPSSLTPTSDLTALAVYEAARDGDTVALEAFRSMGRYLGIALADLLNVLNPEMIVIGGGAAGAWDVFIEHVRTEIDARAFPHPSQLVRIVRAELGDTAGIVGAARTAFDRAVSGRSTGQSLS